LATGNTAAGGDDIIFGDHGVIEQLAGTLRLTQHRVRDADPHRPAENGARDEIDGDAGARTASSAGNGRRLHPTVAKGATSCSAISATSTSCRPTATYGDIDDMGSFDLATAAIGGADDISHGIRQRLHLRRCRATTIDAGHGDNNIVFGDSGRIRSAAAFGKSDRAAPLDGHAITLGLIETIAPSLGAVDTITTGTGRDIILGGFGGDFIYGYGRVDDQAAAAADGNNIVIADHGFIDYVSRDSDAKDIDRIWSTDYAIGGDDEVHTGAGNDIVLGGAGSDDIRGGNGSNILIGDSAELTSDEEDNPTLFSAHEFTICKISTVGFANVDGSGDTLRGGDGNDVLFGGAGDDTIYAGGGDDLVFGDQGEIHCVPTTRPSSPAPRSVRICSPMTAGNSSSRRSTRAPTKAAATTASLARDGTT
jgi:Ca2+-binding RTX toxin-like protein